jgi:hypothetical protein
MRRAIAYTSEILVSESGKVIPRADQEESIRRFAAGNAIDIISWFSDDTQESNVLKRPGIRALLSCGDPCDLILCERASAISRSMADLEPFLKELDRRDLRLECALIAWDCLSQQCRRRSKSLSVVPLAATVSGTAGTAGRYHVATPARLNFVQLVHPAKQQSSTTSRH